MTLTARIGMWSVAIALLAGPLAACGATSPAQTSASASLASHAARAPHPAAPAVGSTARVGAHARRASRIDVAVSTAKATYYGETLGPKLVRELERIAHDRAMLSALGSGAVAGAQAAADAQLHSPINHLAHVTRISVVRGARVLVNATVNSDGVFVVAPGTRTLRARGRVLGTLLVSIQDVTGFVKLVHNLTGAGIVARGGSGRVRASLGAPAHAALPRSGRVTLAGHSYRVRSFGEIAWGGEPLTVWVLEAG